MNSFSDARAKHSNHNPQIITFSHPLIFKFSHFQIPCFLHRYFMYTSCILHIYFMYTSCEVHVSPFIYSVQHFAKLRETLCNSSFSHGRSLRYAEDLFGFICYCTEVLRMVDGFVVDLWIRQFVNGLSLVEKLRGEIITNYELRSGV
jgi:hypothetical protein